MASKPKNGVSSRKDQGGDTYQPRHKQKQKQMQLKKLKQKKKSAGQRLHEIVVKKRSIMKRSRKGSYRFTPEAPNPLHVTKQITRWLTNDNAIAGALALQTISEEEQIAYRQLVMKLRTIVNRTLPGSVLTPYGSSTTGLLLRGSDLDFNIALGRYESIKHCMQRLYSSLWKVPGVKCKANLTHTRIPVIKLEATVAETTISVDLCFSNTAALESSNFVRYCMSLHPKLAPLLMTVKLWGKENDVNDAAKNTLSSYSLFLLCLHYMSHVVSLLPDIDSIVDGFVNADIPTVQDLRFVPAPVVAMTTEQGSNSDEDDSDSDEVYESEEESVEEWDELESNKDDIEDYEDVDLSDYDLEKELAIAEGEMRFTDQEDEDIHGRKRTFSDQSDDEEDEYMIKRFKAEGVVDKANRKVQGGRQERKIVKSLRGYTFNFNNTDLSHEPDVFTLFIGFLKYYRNMGQWFSLETGRKFKRQNSEGVSSNRPLNDIDITAGEILDPLTGRNACVSLSSGGLCRFTKALKTTLKAIAKKDC